MSPSRPTTTTTATTRVHRFLRSALVLLSCLGLAGVSLAATAGGSRSDPTASVLAGAREQLGDAYVWGGNGPDVWDCSGFTSRMWKGLGGVKDIPRTSRLQQAWAVPIPVEQAQPGDLFFAGDPVTHVALVESAVTTAAGTSIVLLDASSSKKGVVRRAAWKSDVIRYGRVPRPGMTPVQPWTPAVAAAPSTPASKPASKPATSKPAGTAQAPRAAASPPAVPSGRGLLSGLPTTPARSTDTALRAARLARAAVGNTDLGDLELIRNVWRRAGGPGLPSSRDGLTAASRRVAVGAARVGDLIVYAAPGEHVGIYVGDGLMVDASRSLGKVVLRTVWAADGVQVRRLPG